jgi:hypothetical protein
VGCPARSPAAADRRAVGRALSAIGSRVYLSCFAQLSSANRAKPRILLRPAVRSEITPAWSPRASYRTGASRMDDTEGQRFFEPVEAAIAVEQCVIVEDSEGGDDAVDGLADSQPRARRRDSFGLKRPRVRRRRCRRFRTAAGRGGRARPADPTECLGAPRGGSDR